MRRSDPPTVADRREASRAVAPRRRPAVMGTIAVLAGIIGMAVAVAAAPGPWTRGYVSEAGATGMPLATAYRAAQLVVAVGVLLLGAAVGSLARAAACLLAGAGAMAAVSGAVPCSRGCPLPPYETATTGDLVHAAASILGMATAAFAMVALAVTPAATRPLRRLALGSAVVTFPLAAAAALSMLLVGRGPLTSTIERLLLGVTACWLVGTGALAALTYPPGTRPTEPRTPSTAAA